MTTKKQVDDVYNRPIDPAKPFERLSMLMDYALGQLRDTQEEQIRDDAMSIHKALSCFYRALMDGNRLDDKRLFDAVDIVLDDLFEKSFPVDKSDPLYIPKI